MQDESKISYWVTTPGVEDNVEDNILTVPTSVIPFVGEIIHINTEMSKRWYDRHFPDLQGKFFTTGVKGDFEVIKIKRWYSVFDFIDEEFNLPNQKTVENFEVFLKIVEDDKIIEDEK